MQDNNNNQDINNNSGYSENRLSRDKRIEEIAISKISKLQMAVVAVLLAVAFLIGFLASNLTFLFSNDFKLLKEYQTISRLIDEINRSYYLDVDKELLLEHAAKGMFEVLDDYSELYTLEEYAIINTQSQGNNTNYGLYVRTIGRRVPSIARVVGNSPAERAGYKGGDEIYGIYYFDEDGNEQFVDTSEMTQAQMLAEVAKHRKFKFKIMRSSDNTNAESSFKEVTTIGYIEPESYNVNYVYYYFDTQNNNMTDYGSGYNLAADAGYIKITSFEGKAGEQFGEAMKLFKSCGKKRLVLDLRDNPGGSAAVLGEIASYLVWQQNANILPVFIARYKDGREIKFNTTKIKYTEYFGEYDNNDKKIAVLVNGSSASASEALSCAIRDYGTGELVGTKTFGKGKMQEYIRFHTLGYVVKVTVALYYSPVFTSYTLEGVGLTPSQDNIVEDNFYMYEYNRNMNEDAQFRRAIEVLYS